MGKKFLSAKCFTPLLKDIYIVAANKLLEPPSARPPHFVQLFQIHLYNIVLCKRWFYGTAWESLLFNKIM